MHRASNDEGKGIIGWFVPDSARGDSEELRRYRLAIASALGLAVVGLPLTVLNYWMETRVNPSILIFAIGVPAMAANALLSRAGVPERIVGALVTLELMISLTLFSCYNGGILSGSVLWLIALPLVGQLLVGPQFGFFCAAFAAAEIVVFYGLYRAGIDLPRTLSADETLLWYAASACTSAIFAAGLGWFFERERRRAEASTRASEERLRLVVENSELTLMSLDSTGRITLSAGAKLEGDSKGFSGPVNGSVFDVFARAQETSIRRALAGEACHFEAEREGRFFDNRLVPTFDASHARTGATCLSLDVTERKRMQSRMALADRMASLGSLSAGIGHEINNPLTYVITNIEYALEQLGDPAQLDKALTQEALEEALDGADRVRKIVAELRVFARPPAHESRAVDLKLLIERAVAMAEHETKHCARLVTDIDDVPAVLGDEGQLLQVLLNLQVNAAQSIAPGARDANEIRVTVRLVNEDKVVIEVTDTGKGISREHMSHLFEPFFATKPETGTGLGLSISHRIVESMGGSIEVETTSTGGSQFRVLLPAACAEAPPVAIAERARAG